MQIAVVVVQCKVRHMSVMFDPMSSKYKLPVSGRLYSCGRQIPVYTSPVMSNYGEEPIWVKLKRGDVVLLLSDSMLELNNHETTAVKLLFSNGKIGWTWWWRGEDYELIS